MFYIVYTLIYGRGNAAPMRIPLGYYYKSDNARVALMDWARGVLALHPSRQYDEVAPDPRSGEKVILHCRIQDRLDKSRIDGIIVENAFGDESPKTFVQQANEVFSRSLDAIRAAVPEGGIVALSPYEEGKVVTVAACNTRGDYYLDISSISRPKGGLLEVCGVDNDSGQPRTAIPFGEILSSEWPRLADILMKIAKR